MSEWTSGSFDPGQMADWVQGFLSQVTGNLRGMVGFPREEAVHHLEDFRLRSLKRHLEARQADLLDMMNLIDQELARRASMPPQEPTSPVE